MQINIEDKSSITKLISIEIPKEKIAAELDKAYGELKKSAKIKGFRKGKVPRKILENRFSKDVHADLQPKLIQDAFAEVIRQYKLPVIGTPLTDPPELDPEKAYAFEISVEVKPELDDIEFEGIALEKVKYEVSEDQIQAQLFMIQKTLAKKETITESRQVKDTDYVLIDYEAFLNGAAFDKIPKMENYMLGIKQNDMPKEFSEKLIGTIPVQDIEIEVSYGDDAEDGLKGKTILYKVKLKEIKEEVLPEINDEMVKELGEYKTIEELKTHIRAQLEKGITQRVKQELAEQIFQHLLKKNEFEIPNALIEAELNGIISEAEQAFRANNINPEDIGLSRETWESEYRETAEKQAGRHMILEKLIIQEKIELSDEELDKAFEKMALGMSATPDAVKNFFNMEQNQNQLAAFKYTQLADKAIDMIIEKAEVTEVEPKEEEPESEDAQLEEKENPTEEKPVEENQKSEI